MCCDGDVRARAAEIDFDKRAVSCGVSLAFLSKGRRREAPWAGDGGNVFRPGREPGFCSPIFEERYAVRQKEEGEKQSQSQQESLRKGRRRGEKRGGSGFRAPGFGTIPSMDTNQPTEDPNKTFSLNFDLSYLSGISAFHVLAIWAPDDAGTTDVCSRLRVSRTFRAADPYFLVQYDLASKPYRSCSGGRSVREAGCYREIWCLRKKHDGK